MKQFAFNFFIISLAIITQPVFTLNENRFRELFEARTPVKEILAEIIPTDPITTYKNFQVLKNHIKKNDDYASYAKILISASQKVLDNVLREINHKGKVNIEKLVEVAYRKSSKMPVTDTNMLQVLGELNAYKFKLLLNIGEEARKIMVDKIMSFANDGSNQNKTSTAEKEAKNPASKSEKDERKLRRSKSKKSSSV